VDAEQRATTFIEGQVAKGEHPVDAINRINVTDQDLGANVASLEQNRRGIYAEAMRHIKAMYDYTTEVFWTNKNAVRDFVREVNGQDSGNRYAKRAAIRWLEATESLRKQYNELGGNIRKLAYGYLPHKWDAYKLSRISGDEFAKEIVPRLDRSKYRDETGRRLTDDQLTEIVKAIHENTTTGGSFGSQFERAMANRHQDRRVLHFKTADDWMDVNAKYGTGSVMEAMMAHANSMSKEIAAMKTWGPSPDSTFRQVLAKAEQMALKADRKSADKTHAKMTVAQAMYDAAIGRLSPIGNMKVFRAFQVIRSLNLLKLGSSAVSALSDGSNVTAVSHAWSIPYVRRYLYGLKAWLSSDYRNKLISQGIGVEALAHGVARYGEEAMSTGATGKFAQFMLRMFLVNHIDSVRRTAAGGMLMNEIERLASQHETMDTLHPQDNAVVLNRGVNATDWTVWRAAGKDLSPDTISKVPDDAIKHLGDPDRLRRDAAQKLLGVALSDVDTVVPLMTAKTLGKVEAHGWVGKRGTLGGELIRSFLTFKSFPLSNFQNHLDRMAGRPTVGGSALYAAQVIATSTVMGAIAVQLKAMASGENPQDMTDPKFAGRAVIQGGALGLYFDILASGFVSDYKHDITDQLGPTVSTIKDMASLINPVNKQNRGEQVTRMVRSYTPEPFYAKAALDRLIFQRIMDFFSPGYAERAKDRVHSQFNSSYYWPPSSAQQVVPPQAPDLSTATGGR
jgi:hypothetical protein